MEKFDSLPQEIQDLVIENFYEYTHKNQSIKIFRNWSRRIQEK